MDQLNTATTVTMPSERELVITRVFDAPRRLVFEAWTKPEHVANWYGLRGSTLSVCEIDLRPDGKWRYVIREGDGQEYGFSGVYQEITPVSRLVYTEGYEAMPGHEYVVTTTFDEANGKTTLRSHLLYQSQTDRDGHVQSGMEYGMNETYSRLDEYLATLDKAVTIARIFDAPRELVWKAWTDPVHLMRWWGPANFTSPSCQIDLRVGGKYLFCMRSPEGEDMWTTGTYREIVPIERLVYTDSLSDAQGNVVTMEGFPEVSLVSIHLEDVVGKTRMTLKHEGLPEGEMSEMTWGGWMESFDKLGDSLK